MATTLTKMSYPKLTKKGWDAIPPEYIYFAVDYDGEQWAYTHEPEKVIVFGVWTSKSGTAVKICVTSAGDIIDWADSLQKRPTTNKLAKTTPTPAKCVSIETTSGKLAELAIAFGVDVTFERPGFCDDYYSVMVYGMNGNPIVHFTAPVKPVNVTVHDAVSDVAVTVHDQISLSKCKCGNNAETEHNCPYSEDILGVSEICNCCKECTYQCSQDI